MACEAVSGDSGEALVLAACREGVMDGVTTAKAIEAIASLYEAALDEGLWPVAVGACMRRVNADCGVLFVHNFADGSLSASDGIAPLLATAGLDASALRSYDEHYCRVNVWVQNEAALAPGRAVSSSMLFPDDRLPHTEFGHDWLRPNDLFYALGGIVSRQGSLAVKASFIRSRAAGAFDQGETAVWQVLMRHVQRAVALRARAQQLRLTADAGLNALDCIPHGVVLLSHSGVALHVNPKAALLLTQRRGLLIDACGSLHAASARDDGQLQRMLRGVTGVASGRSAMAPSRCSMSVRGEDGLLHLFVTPLLMEAGQARTGAGMSCVFITDPTERPLALPERLRDIYGLTGAEARVASELIQGVTLRECAERNRVSLSTARTQLRGAAAKVGVKRQADLVRAILTGPAVFQVPPARPTGL